MLTEDDEKMAGWFTDCGAWGAMGSIENRTWPRVVRLVDFYYLAGLERQLGHDYVYIHERSPINHPAPTHELNPEYTALTRNL